MSEKTLKWMGCSAGVLLAMATLWFYILVPVLKELEDNDQFGEAQLFDVSQDLKHLDTFIADQEYLAQTGLFPPTIQTWDPVKDAGQFLNVGLPWLGLKVERRPYRDKPEDWKVINQPTILIPAQITKQLDEWDKGWLEHAYELDTRQLDFSWMSGLHQYTFWNLEANSPRLDYHAEKPFDIYNYPRPDPDVLKNWSKLRLMQAVKDKDPVQDLKEVRQLARLTLTTEDGIMLWNFVALLKMGSH